MDLEELKKLREKKFQEHKAKKRQYYLKKKLEKQREKSKKRAFIDYENELKLDGFDQKIKDIAKKQKIHIDERKDQITAKLEEYRLKKQEYYQRNKEKRLEYDKAYRERKKEELKEYRRQYYLKNKEKILQRQREKREQELNG